MINSALISIIAKAIDLKTPPPILRYRSKCFHAIHAENARLDKIFSYIKSMASGSNDQSPYVWDTMKLYLLQALSDYPWNISSDSNFKTIILFSECFELLDYALFSEIFPSLSSHGVRLVVVTNSHRPLAEPIPFKPYITHASFSSLNCSIAFWSRNNFPQNQVYLQKIIRHLEGKKKNRFITNFEQSTKNFTEELPLRSISSSMVSLYEHKNPKDLFALIPNMKSPSPEDFVMFLYFYFLFTPASSDLIAHHLIPMVDEHSKGFVFEFFSLSSDSRSMLLETIQSAQIRHHKMITYLSEGLFELLLPFINYFHTKRVVRSDPLLRIIFIISPLGYSIFSEYQNLHSLLDDLTISFLISEAIMPENSCFYIKKDMELLKTLLNSPWLWQAKDQGWNFDQLAQIKEALSEILLDSEDMSEQESVPSILFSGESISIDSPMELQRAPSQPSFTGVNISSRHFLRNDSSFTSIDVVTPMGIEGARISSSPAMNIGILVQETPTKDYSNASTPILLDMEDDHNVIIVETPKKFISCRRSLNY